MNVQVPTPGSRAGAMRVALQLPDKTVELDLPDIPRRGDRIDAGLTVYEVRYTILHAGTRSDGVVATCHATAYPDTL